MQLVFQWTVSGVNGVGMHVPPLVVVAHRLVPGTSPKRLPMEAQNALETVQQLNPATRAHAPVSVFILFQSIFTNTIFLLVCHPQLQSTHAPMETMVFSQILTTPPARLTYYATAMAMGTNKTAPKAPSSIHRPATAFIRVTLLTAV